ncbi:DUF7344 domain-containing protein [Haloprofundus salilacus]|uniref:DUF7344 domain-containing protein n=1 Tax=Haloprofundus salilacus TaxID=2876190 RepID=UPI001CCF1F92|nr:hypothetical protein [Haloprofundus salilacus]
MDQPKREVDRWIASEGLSEGDRIRVLAAEQRRLVLDILTEETAPVRLEQLAQTVTERSASVGGSDASTVERTSVSLYHCHLPLMDDLGVISFDRERLQVALLHTVA